MRWKLNPSPKSGDIKIVTKFLFLPKKINREWRWLEKVSIKQRYYYYPNVFHDFYGWEDLEWVDNK